jgi:pilus assembly protein Flp/PilA
MERTPMNNTLIKLYVMFQDLMNREEGQDLVEYALVIALISIAAVASLTALSTLIVGVFTLIGTKL